MKKLFSLCVGLMLVAIPVFAQDSADALEDYFRKYKYKAIKPPVAFDPVDDRTEKWWRPGFVFVVGNDKRARGVKCDLIFPAAPIKAYWLGDEKKSIKRSGSFSLLANLLQSLGNVSEANTDSGFSWDKNTTIEFSDLRELQPEHAIFKEDIRSIGAGISLTTDSIRMPAACSRAIRKHIREGSSVYLVISSVEAESMSINIDSKSGFSTKADFSLSEMIKLKPGVQASSQNSSSISFSLRGSPVRLAYSAVRIKKAESAAEISTGGAQKNKLTVEVPEVVDFFGIDYEK